MKFILSLSLLLVFAIATFAHQTHIQRFEGEIVETKTVEAKINGQSFKVVVINGYLPNYVVEGFEKDKGLVDRTFVFSKKTLYRPNPKYIFLKSGLSITEIVTSKSGKERIQAEYTSKVYQLEMK